MNFILFLGLYLILFDLDIICIILWILYGGVIIIFFIYSLLWFENIKNNKYINKYRFIYYFFSFILFIFFCLINNLDYLDTNFKKVNDTLYVWKDFYIFLVNDINEELENLGWGILYYSTFFFLILSYMLFLSCCIAIVIILNAKKVKYLFINIYYLLFKKNVNLLSFNIFKYQHFYTQDYENINQIYSIHKNFKVTNKFHKIKNFNRRI